MLNESIKSVLSTHDVQKIPHKKVEVLYPL